MSKRNESVDETSVQTEEPKPELTLRDKIAAELEVRKTADVAALDAAQKRAAETDALAALDIDSDVESMVGGIKTIDADIAGVKTAMAAEIEPLNKQITEIKAKPEYDVAEKNKVRSEQYAALVEKVGETPAKLMVGGAKTVTSGTGTGRGRGSGTRDQVIVAICDDGLSFAEAAEKYDHMGNGEREGLQKVGNLVKRHIDLAIKAGNVVKNPDGTYSRA